MRLPESFYEERRGERRNLPWVLGTGGLLLLVLLSRNDAELTRDIVQMTIPLLIGVGGGFGWGRARATSPSD